MTSDDFVKIFYSNFSSNVDWANIDEIAWMHKEGLFTISSQVIASNDEFLKRIDGDTNALKFEKYLGLPTTKKMLILPYPHLKDVKVFEFCAKSRFFEYIKHKETFLNRQRVKYR